MMRNKILLPQLISMLSAKSGVQKNVAESFLKNFFSILSEVLESHESVKIKDLGTFKISSVGARKSVNVSTGEEIQIPSHFKITFTPSKNLAETVNKEFSWLDIAEISEHLSNNELENVETNEINNSRDIEELSRQKDRNSSSSNNTTPLDPKTINTVTHDNQKEDNREKLGEELEKTFGDIEPVEPFGPIEPDNTESADAVPDNEASLIETVSILDNVSQITESVSPDLSQKNKISGEANVLENEKNEKEFDPYSIDVPLEPVLEEKNEPLYINKDEYENLPKRADIKAIGRHIKRLKNNIYNNEETNKKRSLRYFLLGIAISVILVTGGLFLLYGILMHKGFQVAETNSPSKAETENRSPRNEVIDDEQIPVIVKSEDSLDTVKYKAQASSDKHVSSKEAAPTEPSDIKATDKITNTRYLTTMAKEYYGNYNLWPYIYLENESKLGHPDRIKPGTTVVIPNISKYGIDPSNPKDIEKARKLGVEIYNKYSK